MYPDHLLNLLDYLMVHWLPFFWRRFELVKRVKFGISGYFSENAWREWPEIFACWCFMTTYRTDKINVTVCWFYSLRHHFDFIFQVSGLISEDTWDKWPAFWHADVSWPLSKLIEFWLCSVDFPHFNVPLALWDWSYLGFPGIIWRTPVENIEGDGGLFPLLCV